MKLTNDNAAQSWQISWHHLGVIFHDFEALSPFFSPDSITTVQSYYVAG